MCIPDRNPPRIVARYVPRERKRAIPSLTLPRWRTGRRFAGHTLVGHAEQVSQLIGIDARQANQHGPVADVVVCHVVNSRVRIEQLGAVFEIHTNDKRSGFRRAISWDARQESSIDVQCRDSVRRALFHSGQRECDIPFGVEVDCASGHGSARSSYPQVNTCGYSRLAPLRAIDMAYPNARGDRGWLSTRISPDAEI